LLAILNPATDNYEVQLQLHKKNFA